MFAVAPPALAQGKGRDKAEKQGQHKNDQQGEKKVKAQNRGNSEGKAVRKVDRTPNNSGDRGSNRSIDRDNDDRSGRDRASVTSSKHFSREFRADNMKPAIRRFAVSKRAPERIAAGAVARGFARGLRDGDVVITPVGDRVRVLNRSGVVLVDLDEARARNLGNWRVDPDDRELRGDAPSFCRSGEGHPVWGRQWCINKGFGLGGDFRWGITNDVDDIRFRTVDSGTLTRSVLMDVLGDVVFDRLGLHAITMGYTDPLTGVWLGDDTGPRVLRITSGSVPIAEIVDDNRDNQADVLVVALKPW